MKSAPVSKPDADASAPASASLPAMAPANIRGKVAAIRNNTLVSRIGSKSRWVGFIYKLFVYLILIDLAFVFLYPFLYMVTTSLKQPADLLDFTLKWTPVSMAWENFYYGMKGLQFWTHFRSSAL